VDSVAVKVLLIVAGAIVAETTRQIVEYIKRLTPVIEYSLTPGLPVTVDSKTFCA
jgi:hypothetical protein